jgi:hypothetical protein
MSPRALPLDGHGSRRGLIEPRDEARDLPLLFHRLTNQLGIILANAELLEAKSSDELSRARAVLVVSSALEAMATVRDLRRHTPQSALQ